MREQENRKHLLDQAAPINESAVMAERRDRILIVTVGLPYSGKTQWAYRQGHPIVNPDSIRLALHGQRYVPEAEPFVWAIAKTMVRALFNAGHRLVILDATMNTHKRRREWVSTEWATFYKVFGDSAELCLQRALDNEDPDIVPTIGRMATEHEPLDHSERRWHEERE